MQVKVNTAKQQQESLPAVADARTAETAQPNSNGNVLLAKTMNHASLWASTLPIVCCMGGAQRKVNLKSEGDENSCFLCPPPTPVKAAYRENSSYE